MNTFSDFILIDDDPINNTICKLCIKKTLGDVNVLSYTNPAEGFDFIASEFQPSVAGIPAFIFLDLNMPGISGWDFLDMYERLSPEVKEKFRIYLLSSSINQLDLERASKNKNVTSFITKPLSKDTVQSLASTF